MSVAESYDQTPYTTRAYAETHPAHLEGIAYLFGVDTMPPARARVLEVGCGTGGNLLAMAATHPAASFVGVDISPRQIEEAKAATRLSSIENVEWHAADFTRLGGKLGQFHYIICHGVISWVPPTVRDAILSAIRQHLIPNGVALVSFNTYPGWHARQALREAMIYHAGDDVPAARGFARLLSTARTLPAASSQMLRSIAAQSERLSDDHFLHEFLEEHNHPIYFHEFAVLVGECGLQYVADARSNGSCIEDRDPAIRATLDLVRNDLVRFEQYLDFLRDRVFRRAILCHANAAVDRVHLADRLRLCHVIPAVQRAGSDPSAFKSLRGQPITISDPALRDALGRLCDAAPHSLLFGDLSGPGDERLAVALTELWMMTLVAVRRGPTP